MFNSRNHFVPSLRRRRRFLFLTAKGEISRMRGLTKITGDGVGLSNFHPNMCQVFAYRRLKAIENS